MMLAFAIGAAVAVQPLPQPVPLGEADFDLPPAGVEIGLRASATPLVPIPPSNLDIRSFDAPEAEWRIVQEGPVLAVGAMGGKRSGRPKLAHVALDWSF